MPHVGANRLLPTSSELARDINPRIVFDLIRRRQPLSRADLSRASGLQRSTVCLIVDGLVDGRWILETPGSTTARGRRPTLLHLTSERGNLVCITVSHGVGAGFLLDSRLGLGLHIMAAKSATSPSIPPAPSAAAAAPAAGP